MSRGKAVSFLGGGHEKCDIPFLPSRSSFSANGTLKPKLSIIACDRSEWKSNFEYGANDLEEDQIVSA